MTFQDKFPNQIEFELNRPALTRFYRIQGFAISAIFPVVMSVPASAGVIGEAFRGQEQAALTYKFGISVIIVLGCILMALALGAVIYFAYFHRAAILHAQNERLIVEGPFLRVISGAYVVSDERFHFRDIHTYSTTQGPLQRRLGLKTLSFRSDKRQVPPINFNGLKNPDEVRDMLCEIDAARTPN